MISICFSDLTSELVFAIFQRCNSIQDVSSLARTNRRLYAIFTASADAICMPVQSREIPAYKQALSYARCRQEAERRRSHHMRSRPIPSGLYVIRTVQETARDLGGIYEFFGTASMPDHTRVEQTNPQQFLQWDKECFSYVFFLCLELATERRLHPPPNHAHQILRAMKMRELLSLQYICYWLRKEDIFLGYSLVSDSASCMQRVGHANILKDAADYPMLVIGEFSSAWRMTDIALRDRRRRLGTSAPDAPALCVCMQGEYCGLAAWQSRVQKWASIEMQGDCPGCSPSTEL